MYEARQNKTTIFRTIQSSKQEKLYSHHVQKSVSQKLCSPLIQRMPDSLNEDILYCYKQLGLSPLKDVVRLHIYDPNIFTEDEKYREATRIGGCYDYEGKQILIPENIYTRRLLLHEMGHYKQHMIILRGNTERYNTIDMNIKEYHNFLYHENIDLQGTPLNPHYYEKDGDNNYRVSYISEVFNLKKIKPEEMQLIKSNIESLNNPFFDNKKCTPDEIILGSQIVEKIKILAKSNLVRIAYKTAISFCDEYLMNFDGHNSNTKKFDNIEEWKNLKSKKISTISVPADVSSTGHEYQGL